MLSYCTIWLHKRQIFQRASWCILTTKCTVYWNYINKEPAESFIISSVSFQKERVKSALSSWPNSILLVISCGTTKSLSFLEISALALCLIIRETTHFQTFHQFEALALIFNAMNVSNKGFSCAKRKASTFYFILSFPTKSV